MNNQVEFRAWDTKNKIWLLSTGVNIELDGTVIVNDYSKIPPVRMITKEIVLSQYVGRKDRSGVKIFTGDIIEDDFSNEFGSFTKGRGAVSFCSDCLRFVMDGKHKTETENDHYSIESEGIVIGNIYQNPELIS